MKKLITIALMLVGFTITSCGKKCWDCVVESPAFGTTHFEVCNKNSRQIKKWEKEKAKEYLVHRLSVKCYAQP